MKTNRKSCSYWNERIYASGDRLYVIRREQVETRLQRVRLQDRASLEMEYVIEDLQPNEFDVIGP
jgi:hypothetical protein